MEKSMNNCEMIRRKWIKLTYNAFNDKSLTASRWMWQEIRAHDHLMHCKVDALEKEVKELNAEIDRMRPVVEAAAEFDEPCGDEICASPTCRVARAMNAYRASTGKEDE